jgi:uncharacterized membrane protein YkoI
MKKIVFAVLIASASVFAFATETPKITMQQARKVALKRANGKIESEELEKEHGKLIYSFDIRVPGKTGITEIAVDAIKGNIINVTHETPAAEAAEKKAEAKKH